MKVSLPNGRTTEMSLDMYLALNAEHYHFLVAGGYGVDIGDPFEGSSLQEPFEEVEIFDEETTTPLLYEMTPVEKLLDTDVDLELAYVD